MYTYTTQTGIAREREGGGSAIPVVVSQRREKENSGKRKGPQTLARAREGGKVRALITSEKKRDGESQGERKSERPHAVEAARKSVSR